MRPTRRLFQALVLCLPLVLVNYVDAKPPDAAISPGAVGRVAAAMSDPMLEPWQRQVMQDLVAPAPNGGRDALASSDGSWRNLVESNVSPVKRYGHAAIYDPIRDRIVLFGGRDFVLFGDTWVFELSNEPQWKQVMIPGPSPAVRWGHSAIYDPVGDRMVIHGGDGGGLRNDTWALGLGGEPSWTQLVTSGQQPPGKRNHTAIYDSKRHEMVVFGGADASNFGSNDTWSLSLDGSLVWTRLPIPGVLPEIRAGHTAVHDPIRDRMLMFAGGNGLRDTWILTLGENPRWTKYFPIRLAPGSWIFHHAIYDAIEDRMLVYGGENRDDVWELQLSVNADWVELPTTSPIPTGRSQSVMLFDPGRNRFLVFAGTNSAEQTIRLDDLWTLSLAPAVPQWEKVQPRPPSRMDHTAVYDPIRERVLVFGGRDVEGFAADTWELELTPVPRWTKLVVTGPAPPARDGHAAIYEPAGDRMLVFGGGSLPYRNDVWALSLANDPEWQELQPSGTPPPMRWGSTAIYDSDDGRMIIYGGADASTARNDTWSLTTTPGLESWSEVVPAGVTPAGHVDHTAVYDASRNQMLVFGGFTPTSYTNDVWVLTLGVEPTWSFPTVVSTRPSARSQHAAIYDPLHDRMLVFGGFGVFSDTWALDLAGPLTWTQLTPAGTPATGGWGRHTATYDPGRAQMVVFGGTSNSFVRNDTWALFMGEATDLPERLGATLDVTVSPNPFAATSTIRFALRERGPVRIVVYDVSGRLVRVLRDGEMYSGAHEVAWDGDDAAHRRLSRGTYFIRLEAAGRTESKKVVLRW